MYTPPTTPAAPTTQPAGRRRRVAVVAGLAFGTVGIAAVGFGGHASAIVDGTPTDISDNPWQVALTDTNGEQFCGGSIVSDRVIVTAAHCTQGAPADEISVRAGVTDLSTDDGQTRSVTKVIEHPKYVEGVGDIAMLVLDRPFDESANIAALPLATADDIAKATTGRVTGWGVTSEQADGTPDVLQSTDVPLVSDADCSLVDVGNDDELCAGGTGTDSCYGDSGGPLTVATENGHALAGVVSWGEECGGATAGVYAEVPTFATWVNERIANPDAPAGDRLPTPDEQGPDGDSEIVEIEEAFIDSLGDDIDTLSDAEFWERYEQWLDERGDSDSDTDGDADNDSDSDDDASDVDIDSMTDAEFQEFIDAMTDEEFDTFLEQYDADQADDAQHSEESDDVDDDDLDDFDLSDFDVNGDNIVQWTELAELLEV